MMDTLPWRLIWIWVFEFIVNLVIVETHPVAPQCRAKLLHHRDPDLNRQ